MEQLIRTLRLMNPIVPDGLIDFFFFQSRREMKWVGGRIESAHVKSGTESTPARLGGERAAHQHRQQTIKPQLYCWKG